MSERYFFRFDWYICFWQWGLGISLFPRDEYGIELIILCCVITLRWRDGFTEWTKREWMRSDAEEPAMSQDAKPLNVAEEARFQLWYRSSEFDVAYRRGAEPSHRATWSHAVDRLNTQHATARKALEEIAAWTPPRMQCKAPGYGCPSVPHTHPMGYEIGSNGVRDYFRSVARNVLAALAEGEDAQ